MDMDYRRRNENVRTESGIFKSLTFVAIFGLGVFIILFYNLGFGLPGFYFKRFTRVLFTHFDTGNFSGIFIFS